MTDALDDAPPGDGTGRAVTAVGPGRTVAPAVSAPSPPSVDLHAAPHEPPRAGRIRPRWWREVALIAVFYAAYTVIRDLRGTRPVSAATALANAHTVISWERDLGIFHEAQVQHWFLHSHFVVEVLDVWYGSTHFIVTAAVLIVLFFANPGHYRRWRNTLAAASLLALAGFAFFPMMPPRLLPAGYGFTDTLRTIGGLWAFNSGPMPRLTDQFAAMPSLHFAWALWCGIAVATLVGHWWARVLAMAYPLGTLICVIVTGNHYFADVIAGALIIVIGYGAARAAEAIRLHHSERRRALTPAYPESEA